MQTCTWLFSYLTVLIDAGTGQKGDSPYRLDGRRQLLVYLSPELIKDIKKRAVDDDATASAIVEEAL
jgi:hypothetical protein